MAKRVNLNLASGATVQGGDTVKANINPLQGNASLQIKPGKDLSIKGGVGISPAGIGPSGPKVTIGHGTVPEVAATVGSIGGAIVGGPAGSAVGSAALSAQASVINEGLKFVKHKKDPEHKDRDSLRELLQLGTDGQYALPDGTVANFYQDSHEGTHKWTDPSKATQFGDRDLFSYDVDYTNDLDYLASMGGISLTRLLTGGKNKATDQLGAQVGNQSLGKVGYQGQLTFDNFNSVMTNLRSVYANKGIKTKDEMLGLANKAFSEGRINETDYEGMKQSANMIFENNFSLAQTLMSNRWNGLKAAAKTPADTGDKNTGKGHSLTHYHALSPQEAMASVQPYFDFLKTTLPKKNKGLQTAANITQGFGLVGAAASTFKALDNLSGGSLSGGLKDLWKNISGTSDQIIDSSGQVFNTGLDSVLNTSSEIATEAIPSDFQLDTNLSPDISSADSLQLPTELTDLFNG